MKNRMHKLLVMTSMAAFAATPMIGRAQSADDNAEDHYSQAITSSVRVLAQRADGSASYGTGWVIQAADKENRAGAAVVVTARHVVEGAIKVTVVESGSELNDQKAATVIAAAPEQDTAFLEVKGLTEKPLTLTRAKIGVGAEVAAAGYTTASDENETGGRAKVASLKRGGLSKLFNGPITPDAQSPIDQVEFDAPVQPGFSGGPVLNKCGLVVGMTVADGGHVHLGEGQNVSMAQGVSTAVAADELIRAAKAHGVEVTAIETACDVEARIAPPPPPPAACPAPYMSVDANGNACVPITPSFPQQVAHSLKSPIGLLLALAGIALLIVFGTIAWLMNRRRTSSDTIAPPSVEPFGTEPLGSIMSARTNQRRLPGLDAQRASELRLTGRGPSNEPINLTFSSDELADSPVMLGVEGDANGRIPDRRDQKKVSRHHARLGFDGQNFTIEDNKSMNKTRVSGALVLPAAKRVLVSGDDVELADVTLHVAID